MADAPTFGGTLVQTPTFGGELVASKPVFARAEETKAIVPHGTPTVRVAALGSPLPEVPGGPMPADAVMIDVPKRMVEQDMQANPMDITGGIDIAVDPALPTDSTGRQFVQGVKQGAAELVKGLTSPLGVAAIGASVAVPPLAPVIAGGFSLAGGYQAAQQAERFGTAAGEGNVQEAAREGFGLGANTLMLVGAPLTAAALAKGKDVVVPKETVPETPRTVDIEGQPLLNLPSETSPPTETPPATGSPLWDAITSGVGAKVTAFTDALKQFGGKTLPITTRISQEAGEKGARYLSSKIAAQPLAEDFIKNVVADSEIDPVKFGAALTEDNLRSVREGFVAEGKSEQAAAVRTLVGEDRPFATEKEYQDYLNSPEIIGAIERYKAKWDEQIEPMYKRAMDIDPESELSSRGFQTGARVNLLPEEIAQRNEGQIPSAVASAPEGGQGNTLKRKSPFARKAYGTAEGYRTNIRDMMNNTISRQLEIANKNAFDKALIDSGNAVIDKPGQEVVIGGQSAVPFDYVRRTIVSKNEGETTSIPQNRKLYVNRELAEEYRRAANLDAPQTLGDAFQPVADTVTKLQLAGFTDATVHVSNLFTTLFTRPGIIANTLTESLLAASGRADIPFVLGKVITKAFADNTKQMAELSEIGAMRGDYPATGVLKPLNSLVHWADKTMRLVLDDAYSRMVKEGATTASETGRREFVNQVGQYNKRAQTKFKAFLRDTKIAPFVTAGTTFTTLGAKNMTLSPGVKGSSLGWEAALRAEVAAKWVGSLTLIGAINYMLTGKLEGRPGTGFGRIDTGRDDESGRPLSIPALDLVGFGRGLRLTGARAVIDAKRLDLPTQTALDGAARDIINTVTGPLHGPIIRTMATGASGYDLAVGVGRKYPVVPPNESQFLSDASKAIMDINPIAGSIAHASEPGATLTSTLSKQFPRYLPQPGKPAAMVENYAAIVRMAKTGHFTDDLIGRVRKMSPADRNIVVTDAYYAIDVKDRAHFLRTLKQRRIDFVLGTPTHPSQ